LFGQWKVMQAARAAGVFVLLDGQGADEILGGYHKFLAARLLSLLRAHDPAAVRFAWSYARHVGGPRTLVEAGYRYLGRFGGSQRGPTWLLAEPDTPDTAPAIRRDMRTMQIADIERWSLPNLLSYVDRSSMAFGVETRLPYLDPDVAAIALAMPADVLTNGGWSKWPLRRTLADRAASGPAWRRGKQWFGVPQRVWMRGPLAPFVDSWCRAPHPIWGELVDLAAMRRYGEDWLRRDHAGAAADNGVFEMVALDRFLWTWFPRGAG
jgi:asparagine synthase (glutamine-hydrolysing)